MCCRRRPNRWPTYVPWVKTGNLVYISGQGAMKDGKLQYTGKVGDTLSIEDAIASARLTGDQYHCPFARCLRRRS